ncbi:MAG: CocE/NonD family hydrolase [Acidimicrobiales bacterium]
MTLLVDYDCRARMSDGVTLAADVFRPASAGRYPVILMRTPYGKAGWPLVAGTGADPLAFARKGYAVVLQDCRGTGASGGLFRGLKDEGADGAETIAWAASQPWSNGRVAMIGGSYLGGTQLLAASEAPPALQAITPYVTSGWETRHQGGAFRLGVGLAWCAAMALAVLNRQDTADADTAAQRERVDGILADLHGAYRHLPLVNFAGISPWFEATFGQLLLYPDGDEFLRPGATAEHARTIRTPGLHIAGWHDFLLDNSLRVFEALRRDAATEHARENQRLIVTPWGHGPTGETIGDVWLGPKAQLDFFGVQLQWFDAWLKDAQIEGDRVQIFVQGANKWRGESDWPLSRAVPNRWHLHADGELSRDPPRDAPPAEYMYDPSDPVPTTSGQAAPLGADGAFAAGPRDRRRLHRRPDVLLYSSDVLSEDYEVTGAVFATLHVATSALDTDFTVTLLDVHPDGRAIGITDGILRLRYRERLDVPQLAEPGRVYEIKVDMVATSIVFLAGHRIAIEISSSNFPRFDRNPNHGGVIAEATESDFVIARQKIFQDASHASYVTLPHVPSSGS